ncbi:MAG TPA: zinc dependent phospholipase C family protein [Verrucomicrobiae bacterium]|nr:zinc dependent phospholipase C family protein [Verrucomicrobiae bacterium]
MQLPGRPRSLRLFFLTVCSVLFFSAFCGGYSVLTHEEIVDLVWDDQIKPLLLEKYPGLTVDQLREAHAYAYGGCLIQDMGYYPSGNKYFSDLAHYVRSGDFVIALLGEAQNVNEYAFALGALSHYVADIVGHPTINFSVAREFPKLRKKYGDEVTYAQDPKAHIRTEFGFDMVQVAKHRYAPQSYHDFIGFEVATPVLQRAFKKTYGLELTEVFPDLDLSIGSYRHAVSKLIPEMTRVALLTQRADMVKEDPNFSEKKFLYRLKRADYEREWGKKYDKPGLGARILAFLYRLLPKFGSLKTLAFMVPTKETEDRYIKSVDSTVDRYRAYLLDLRQGHLRLQNDDCDTGKQTKPGEYTLTDRAYAKLLGQLADKQFRDVSPDLKQNILAFYANPDAPNATRQHRDDWRKIMSNLEKLKQTPSLQAGSP